MRRLYYLVALPLVSLGGIQQPSAQVMTGGTQEGPRCEIRATESAGGVQLEGVVRAHKHLTGEYRFAVEKEGASGSSSTSQAGGFKLRPAQESVIGRVGLGLGAGDVLVARLTVSWPDGEVSCERRYPSRS